MFAKPKEIGNVEIKNRFVRSATYEGLATEDGEITDNLINFECEYCNNCLLTLAKAGLHCTKKEES